MLNALVLAVAMLSATSGAADPWPVEVHRLIVAERFEQADAVAQIALGKAQGEGAAAEHRRLDAINLLIDSAIAQHTLTSDACGRWIDAATELTQRLYGDKTRFLSKLWAAKSLRLRRSAKKPEDVKQANALAQQSVDRIAEAGSDVSAADVAFVYQAAAAMSVEGGRFDQAVTALQQAHHALEKTHTDYERAIDAIVLSATGPYELQMGKPAQAAIDARAGVELAKHIGGASSRLYAATLTDLGKVQFFSTDYVAAKSTLQDAVAIMRKHPEETLTASIAAGFLANAFVQLGDPDAARPYYRESIDHATGDAASLLSGRLNGLAVLEKTVQHFDVSHALFQEALAIDEQLHGADYYGLVPILNNLGVLSLKQDDLTAAQSEYQRALDIATAHSSGGGAFELLSAREGLASVAIGRGQPRDADALLAQSTAELTRVYGESHPDLSYLRCEQALAKARLNQYDDAFALAQSGEAFRVDLLLRTAPALGERETVNLKGRLNDCGGLVAALAAASQSESQVQRAWQLLAASRGIATHLSALRLAAARKATDAVDKEARSTWETAATRYADLLLRTKVDADALAKAGVALQSAEARLGTSPGKNVPGMTDLDLPALLKHQMSGSVLVAYFVTDRFDLDAAARGDPQVRHLLKSPRSVYAFVRQNGKTKLIALGDGDDIEFKIDYWNRLLRDPNSDRERLTSAGEAVRVAVWNPLGIASSSAHVFVVPDGALYRVNFAALPDGDRYLVERGLRVHLLDSERDLSIAGAAASSQKLLMIGSPEFGGDATATPLRSDDCASAFTPLPATREEMERIGKMWRDASGQAPVMLSGRDATKGELRASAAGSEVIHLATHAAEFDGSCNHVAARGLGLSAGKKTAPKSVALALAGANSFLENGDNKGILTSEEALALPLDGTRWVVLSACDTGLGPVVDGEGVFGLRRAFRLAGAQTVVMSLWEADDIATAQWMEAMYRARLHHHASVPDAIAEAQLSVLSDRRARGVSTHPYFWAAFVASGDWH